MVGRKKNSKPWTARTPRPKPIPSRLARFLYPYQRRWVDDPARFKIACKARQIGFTFAATLRAVWKRLNEPGLTVWLSASERQAVEALAQVRHHLGGLGVDARFQAELIAGTDMQQHRVSFPNGSRIIALPANPDTVRGFAGDVILDEFAFHRDSHAIWRAAFATTTRGFQLEVISTPNGTQGKYYELARQAGLVSGIGNRDSGTVKREDGSRFTVHDSRSPWSAHWCDIFTASSLGFGVDINSLRAAVDDEDTWQQEFCCRFLSDAAHYLPLELVVAAETPSTPLGVHSPSLPAGQAGPAATPPALSQNFYAEPPGTGLGEFGPRVTSHESPLPGPPAEMRGANCYLGVDIGRKRDKTVLWLLEECDGILWTRMVRVLERTPFASQRAAIESLLTLRASQGGGTPTKSRVVISRCALDATGIGAMLAEELHTRFGARVEPVHFTLAVKEDLAVRLKRRLEERRLRIPYDPAIRRALAAVKRYATPTGHFRFDAARTEEGHADEFWALALACRAADHTPLSTEFLPTQLPSAFRLAHAFAQIHVF